MSRQTLTRLLALCAIAAVIASYFAFGLGEYLTFERLAETQKALADYYASNRALVIALYMAAYIVMAGLSLPGATAMTLIGGAVFGLWLGTVIVSFASSLGALLACAVVRHIAGRPLREGLRARYASAMDAMDRGVAEEGAFYLFSLRLVPIFPFFIVNIAAGLTAMRMWTFYWVSQLGMLPVTIVYVNAGQELGRLNSLSGILTLRMFIAFALLGLAPLAARKAIALYRRGRKGRRGRMPETDAR